MSELFEDTLKRVVKETFEKEAELFDRVDAHVGKSIKDGSLVTGAPGQPIKSGALYDSYQRVSLGPQQIAWLSESPYAHVIEDNLRGATLRSEVGGFHSVKMTRIGFKRIVEHEIKLIGGAVPALRGRGSKTRDPKSGRFV
jgi:hypothetical protein